MRWASRASRWRRRCTRGHSCARARTGSSTATRRPTSSPSTSASIIDGGKLLDPTEGALMVDRVRQGISDHPEAERLWRYWE